MEILSGRLVSAAVGGPMRGLMCKHVSGQVCVCVCVCSRDRMGGAITDFTVEHCLCLLKPLVSAHFLCLQDTGVCHRKIKIL